MKILHISRTMGQGGAEKIVFQLCKDNNFQQQFVISTGGSYVQKLDEIGVKHYKMPDINSKNPITMIICFWKIFRVVRMNKIQIVHSHHRMAAFYARLVAALTKVQCVYTAHNIFFNKKKLLRFALKNTKIIAVGDGVKQNLVNFFGIDSKRVVVVYNSINTKVTNIFNQDLVEAKQSGKYLVGTIGRITKQKGIDIFIKALAEFSKVKKNTLGVIVGDGDDLELMKRLAMELKINDKILFLGYQPNVLDIIKQLDLIVLASRWEGLPLTPIEVFSQNNTIIATDISGNNEVVKDHYNGLLFQKNSVFELVRSMKLLSSNELLKKRLELNAHNTFQSKYSYDRFISGYNTVYSSLSSSKHNEL
ncbi:glycosyltransferase [Latilactobacillus curvatus]|uniref:glycosyltransferase n=1 Tax=Latilactobacillus curvatus TaxID=28038 RepID=UPI001C002687|nr:glycosyltransferase [Latilactobacillus curvatus]QWF36062.1 glycosyltransferase [Latilactobacillus curvatus]